MYKVTLLNLDKSIIDNKIHIAAYYFRSTNLKGPLF